MSESLARSLTRQGNTYGIKVPMGDTILIVPEKKKKRPKLKDLAELPDYCQRCGSTENLTRHHHKEWNEFGHYRKTGYRSRVCRPCHDLIERKINKMIKKVGKRKKNVQQQR